MNKLINNQLKNGMLLKVNQKHLIEKYNKTLYKITKKETKLEEFDIDISGFSPQISEELNDINYLNKGGINKYFIIINSKQKNCTLLNSYFSNKKFILQNFIESNIQLINKITLNDVLYGHFQDNIVKINDINDLLKIKNVEIQLFSLNDYFNKINILCNKKNEFVQSDQLWFDNNYLNSIIDLSKELGYIDKSLLEYKNVHHNFTSFYTSHLNGLYKFDTFVNNQIHKHTIIPLDKNLIKEEQNSKIEYIPFEFQKIVLFLEKYQLIDSFNSNYFKEHLHLLKFYKNNILILEADKNRYKVDYYSQIDLNKFEFEYYEKLPLFYHTLNQLIINIENNKNIKIAHLINNNNKTDEDYNNKLFLFNFLIRPNFNYEENKNLFSMIQHLLVHFNEYDFLRTYAFNKELFYQRYEKYSESLKEYVINFLLEHYVPHRLEIKNHL